MKVKELIEELRLLDPELAVEADGDGTVFDIEGVEVVALTKLVKVVKLSPRLYRRTGVGSRA